MPRQSGFTLVEIMIVVAIIGLLAAVAVPNFMRAQNTAKRQACVIQLKNIEGAKVQWSLENKKGPGDVPGDGDLFGPGLYMKDRPTCPAGGTYDLKSVADKPSCSVPDHTY